MTIRFGLIGIDHRHAYGMAQHLIDVGAEFAGWCTEGTPPTLPGFLKRFPDVARVSGPDALLSDGSIDLILTAAVPADRAAIAIDAMRAGKNVMSDKPGCLNLADLAQLQKVQAETGRIWSVNFSERFQVPSVTKAAELVSEGAIGRVIQTLGLGPHRLNAATRPDWFWQRHRSGGILADIASHQIDQFLFLTGSKDAEITMAEVACHMDAEPDGLPQYFRSLFWGGEGAPVPGKGFQDFGQMALRSDTATGYIRVDWFTADALPTWGDGRLFLLGTEGTIELRKYVDVAGQPGTDHLFLTNGTRCERLDASGAGRPYFAALLADVRDRTETAMPQAHAFKVTELAIQAQALAEQC